MSARLKNKESELTLNKQAITKFENTQEHIHKRTLLRSVKNLFIKASLALSVAATKLRSFADKVLSSDEVVDELFLVTSSSSLNSSVLELEEQNNTTTRITDPLRSLSTTRVDSQSDSMTVDKLKTNASTLPTFQEFDSIAEANELRKENKPFIDGAKVWGKRRNVWLNASPDEKVLAKQKSQENSLNGISRDSYPVIYTNLIEKQKTLKKPMNLKHVLKVINAGWISTKKWERAAQGLA